MLTRFASSVAMLAFMASAAGQIAIVDRLPGTPQGIEFRISHVEVNADIVDQVAEVQMAQTFRNVSQRTLETQFLFPLPDEVAIHGLTLIVDGKELTGNSSRKIRHAVNTKPSSENRKTQHCWNMPAKDCIARVFFRFLRDRNGVLRFVTHRC